MADPNQVITVTIDNAGAISSDPASGTTTEVASTYLVRIDNTSTTKSIQHKIDSATTWTDIAASGNYSWTLANDPTTVSLQPKPAGGNGNDGPYGSITLTLTKKSPTKGGND